MFLSVLLLIGLIKALSLTGRPFLCAGISGFVTLIFGLFFGALRVNLQEAFLSIGSLILLLFPLIPGC